MVTIITYPERLLNALNYHEKKVPKGMAECLHAENFLLDANQINFYDKLNRFQNLIELNKKIQTNLLHVSLNFEPSEQFSKKELIELGTTYMERIGFGDQPYLVYQHFDAGHPHIHILTTTIKHDGSPIYLHNIGRNLSEKARTDMELEYNLVQAKGRGYKQDHELPFIDIDKILYGKTETKRGVTNVLDAVIKKYKYTSLHELNAILGLRNVYADRGKEGGRIHRTNGLVYGVLDRNGNKKGKPIKASSIYSKPTLAVLEKYFSDNKIWRLKSRADLKKQVNEILNSSGSMLQFIAALKHKRIDSVIRRNDIGFIYGITFVDHKSKCVFNGSDLDKKLSAAAIQQRLSSVSMPQQINEPQTSSINRPASINIENQNKSAAKPIGFHFEVAKEKEKSSDEMIKLYDLLKRLMESEKTFNQIPFGLTKKKKKRKKKKN